MYDLIGKPYRLGSDGADGCIDCIHLVYIVLDRLNIPCPSFNPAWYDSDWRVILKALRTWGARIDKPSYDGDVVLLSHSKFAFGVVWQNGILYISDPLKAVSWSVIPALTICRVYRHNSYLLSGN